MKPSGSAGRWSAIAALVAGFAGIWGCAKPPVAEVYPQVAEYDGRRIDELAFVDTDPFPVDSLAELTQTSRSGCSLLGFLPFCFPGTDWGERVERLNMRTVGEDLGRLEALYRQNGYFGTRVVPEIEEIGEDGGPIRVRFVVQRGDGIVLDSLVVEGTEGIVDPAALEGRLPLRPGELLNLADLVASADSVLEALRTRGHAYAQVLRNYGVDTVRDRATVQLLAVPGPRVVVDSVRIDGLDQLDRDVVARQLTFAPGALLRLADLRTSQQNLYELEMVRFASVAVAADSLQRTPDDSTDATVRVAVGEAPEHVVETQVGFGTVECIQLGAQWTDRSVLGGGRKLTLAGSVSRIGLGDPVGGLSGICRQGEDEEIATNLDYRIAADFTQPFFVSPRNQLSTTAYSERQSEPGLFQRTATGARITLTHRLRRREFLTGGLAAEYRDTRATAELYCFEFRACGEEEIARFQGAKWQNGLTANWIRDRGNSPVNPTSGYVLQSSAAWSTPLLASDYDFLRANLEASVYRSIGHGVVLAGFARFGSFVTRATLGVDDFIPPEDRFFAGGSSSVRGFDRFGLGPGLYVVETTRSPDSIVASDTLGVEFFPSGGVSIGVVSAEARFPSPVLRDLLGIAVFVDAGTIGLDPIWRLQSQWRATPGVGLRIHTPVGPGRIDLGYNPYPPQRGPLYATEPGIGSGLMRIADDYRPASPDYLDLDRFRLHIAVGQAF